MSCSPAWLCAATLLLSPPSTAPEAPPQGSVEAPAPAKPATLSSVQERAAVSEPLVTDRPDATESAETVAPGLFQLESGYTFTKVEREKAHSLGELLLRIGIADDLELRAGFNSYEWASGPGIDTSGLSDTFVGLKWRLAEAGDAGSGRPAIAILAGTSLPTGADGLSDGVAQPEVLLAAGLDLSERLSVGANVGWALLQDGDLDERFSELRSSLAFGYGLSERWGAYVEYFGAYGTDGRDDENFVNGGLTYLVHNDLQLDGRIGYGLNDRDDDLFVGIGAAVRW